MPETRSAPTIGTVRSNWMAMDSLAHRADDDYGLFGGVDDEAVIEPVPDIPGARRSRRTAAKVRAVIAEATGVELDELDGIDFRNVDTVADIVTHDLTDPAATFAALDVVLQESRIDQHRNDEAGRILRDPTDSIGRAKAGDSDRRYVLREQAWREANGLSRKKKRGSAPSEQPDSRRAAYIKGKAKRLGISVEEAAAPTRVHKGHGDAER